MHIFLHICNLIYTDSVISPQMATTFTNVKTSLSQKTQTVWVILKCMCPYLKKDRNNKVKSIKPWIEHVSQQSNIIMFLSFINLPYPVMCEASSGCFPRQYLPWLFAVGSHAWQPSGKFTVLGCSYLPVECGNVIEKACTLRAFSSLVCAVYLHCRLCVKVSVYPVSHLIS